MRKYFKRFLVFHNMKQNETKKSQKVAKQYECDSCNYITCKVTDFNKHLKTMKHAKCENETLISEKSKKVATSFQCDCGMLFNSRTTLWRHRKKCDEDNKLSFVTPELVMELIKDNKDLKQIILEQSSTISSLVKNGTNNNTNSLNNNNNKTFNLQFFLNETCKDAMNIMEFVDSIKLQLSDLERMGDVGYTQGISNIITSNLKALDVTQRPVHCTDKKRETMYVKDDDKWEKEDEMNTKLRYAIRRVANKNLNLLPQFREKYPDYSNSSSKISDKYDKIALEAFGGNEKNKDLKIIHNISKCVFIDKY